MQATAATKPEKKKHGEPSTSSITGPLLGQRSELGTAAGFPLFLQAKFAISQPGDLHEHEADCVAEQVMRMPEPVLQRQCAAGGPLCPAWEEEASVAVSRKAQVSVGGEAPASVHSVVSSPGQPLSVPTRAFFEPRFGKDLGHVRVHTDGPAQQSARDVDALAYTVGSHVVFGAGRYAPGTSDGKRLLAHELAHVRQQNGGERLVARQTADWNPGVAHGHTPTGRWADVQRDATRACAVTTASTGPVGFVQGGIVDAGIACACATMSPANVLALARGTVLEGSPLGQAHLDHYLTGGGVNLAEDLNEIIQRDEGIRGILAAAIILNPTGFVTIAQGDYAVDDFRNAFGAIDRMDYEVDAAAGTVHVWFQDRYEWHPVGYGYSSFPGDGLRGTNCVHAAAVELQSSGAADYWMFGNAAVPLSLITGSSGAGSGSSIPW